MLSGIYNEVNKLMKLYIYIYITQNIYNIVIEIAPLNQPDDSITM